MTSILDNKVNLTNSPIRASLAPMAGYTDWVFRKICADLGADKVVSEMISSIALTMNDRKTGRLARIYSGEAPVILQIFGHDPEIMARAAEILLSGNYNGCEYASAPAGIDINMGCPMKKIVSCGDGSALMRTPELAERITASVKNVCVKYGVPLSVKFRLGWDDDSVNFADFGLCVARGGADKITLHTRTRAQMYAPSAKPEACRVLKDALVSAGFNGVTLAGNGDISSYEDALKYIELGCDEVAVGRAATGDPWLFSALSSPDTFVPTSIDERIDLVKFFVREVVADRGEVCGIRESRSRAAAFIKGVRGSAKIRDNLNRAETLTEFLKVLETARNQDE